MSLTIGDDTATDDTYWSNFGTSVDTGGYYFVSHIDGSDSNDGRHETVTGIVNSGVPEGPFATIAKAMGTTAGNEFSGSANFNDPFWSGKDAWLLIEKGGTHTISDANGIRVKNSGASSSSRTLISSYDRNYPVSTYGPNPVQSTATRPKLQFAFQGIQTFSGAVDNFAICGLELYAYRRDPHNGSFDASLVTSGLPCGINFLVDSQNVLVEDCKISYFGLNIQKSTAASVASQNWHFRRCIIVDSVGYAAGGMFSAGAGFDTVITANISQCLFDHNGWSEHPSLSSISVVSGFNHNIYNQVDCRYFTMYGNTLANDGSAPATRSSFDFRNNLSIGGSTGVGYINVNDNSYASYFRDNVITELGKSGSLGSGGIAMFVGSNDSGYYGIGTIEITNNIFCHNDAAPSFEIACYCSADGINEHANIYYHCLASTLLKNNDGSLIPADFRTDNDDADITSWITVAGSGGTDAVYENINVAIISSALTPTVTAQVKVTVSGGAVTALQVDGAGWAELHNDHSSNNNQGGAGYSVGDVLTVSQAGVPAAFRFVVPSGGVTHNTFSSSIDPSPSSVGSAGTGGYPNPQKTLDSYAIQFGYGTTSDDIMTAARANRKGSWDANCTAPLINDWFRDNFGIGTTPPTDPPVSQSSIKSGKHRGFPHKHI